MKMIKSIIRPNKVDEVKDALAKLNIAGMTVTEVRGFGRQRDHTETYRGTEYHVDLTPKMKVEVVADVMVADDVVRAIGEAARTGKIGDGKVWVTEINQVMRIRTGEMGLDALT